MAKHGKKGYRRYLKGKIDIALALGTLATKDLVLQAEAGVLDEPAYLSSVKGTWSLDGFQNIQGDGPVIVGVAHSDYTVAEIEEWIENTGSWTRGDKVQQETARRFIREVGVFTADSASTETAVLNDGKPITTKCGWVLVTGQTVKVWAYNAGADALSTGGVVHVLGHANLWPSGK